MYGELRRLIGKEFNTIHVPQIRHRASDGGTWFPYCSILFDDQFLVAPKQVHPAVG